MLPSTPFIFLIPFLASPALALPTLSRRTSILPKIKAFKNSSLTTNATLFNSTPTNATLSNATSIPFASCPINSTAGELPAAGEVHGITISPCTRGGDDEPCRFIAGNNYTITVNYTSFLNASLPRTSLIARDDTLLPSEEYPYSGQSFGACGYTPCPVEANVTSLYTYNFVTYLSPFNFLTINMTQTLDGPSLLCAGFYAQYLVPVNGTTWAVDK